MRSNYYLYTFSFSFSGMLEGLRHGTSYGVPDYFKTRIYGVIFDEGGNPYPIMAYYYCKRKKLNIAGFERTLSFSTVLSFTGKQLITMHSMEGCYEK